MEIKYFNREKGEVENEKVYGSEAVNWLYDSASGKMLTTFLVKKPLSKLYGALQSHGMTKKKVKPFIKDFNINMEEYLPEEGRTEASPYSSFNQFFIRRFKEGKRPFAEGPKFPAFSEARYFGYDALTDDETIPVKGKFLTAKALLANDKWAPFFEEGPCLLARLCPVDYHRFHFPDDGEVLDFYPVEGALHSVNPLALKKVPEIFSINERAVTIFETKHFGKLAYVEVGAICVGKIIQSREMRGEFKRGEEKGYFLFGGSTVIVLGEKGKWKPDDIVLEHTKKGMEVYQKLGSQIGEALN
ncbi:MAG: phosphatidylserine decarboxylase [Halobacteriovoraceae bacterium]|nr:phosphatidylserine decarboxylase [Halobacteriovoraceae bacterium]MBC98239.1 phosphatidylserine decarboxylase [Halobacteriovoraceae bacterium]